MKTALYVGKPSWGKGIDLFVDALARVEAGGVVVGAGPLYGEVASRALGLPVVFMGQIAHGFMPGYYRRADVTVVPSRWQEPFGRVALEALWYGCPLVVTRCGGLPEIAAHGQAIVVEPSAQAIAEGIVEMLAQLRQPPDRERLRKAFGETPVRAHLDMYRGLLCP